MTLYSQRDPRWASIKINNTSLTIATDGCLICALSSVADVPPNEVVTKIGFDGAQVSWTGLDKIGLELVEKTNPYDNSKVLGYIAANGQCIVRVDWDGSPKTGGDTHFVVYTGNQKLLDPWTGTERNTNVYPLVTGFRAVRKISMANELETCMKDRQKFWDERDSLLREVAAPDTEGGLNAIRGLKSRITDLSNQLGNAKAETATATDKLNVALGRTATLEVQVKSLTDQVKTEQDTIDEVVQAKGKVVNDLVSCQNQVATLQQGQAQGKYTFTLKQVWDLLWNGKITVEK